MQKLPALVLSAFMLTGCIGFTTGSSGYYYGGGSIGLFAIIIIAALLFGRRRRWRSPAARVAEWRHIHGSLVVGAQLREDTARERLELAHT
jgi:hypothetical protein